MGLDVSRPKKNVPLNMLVLEIFVISSGTVCKRRPRLLVQPAFSSLHMCFQGAIPFVYWLGGDLEAATYKGLMISGATIAGTMTDYPTPRALRVPTVYSLLAPRLSPQYDLKSSPESFNSQCCGQGHKSLLLQTLTTEVQDGSSPSVQV